LRILEEKGAKIFMEKTGHVHIKYRMAKEGALLGGGVSGHFFSKIPILAMTTDFTLLRAPYSFLLKTQEVLGKQPENSPIVRQAPRCGFPAKKATKALSLNQSKNIFWSKKFLFWLLMVFGS
jgi:phosphomannomutase